jgi:integrase
VKNNCEQLPVRYDGARSVFEWPATQHGTYRLDIIKGILQENALMKRWQDPHIEVRKDAPRPYYFIRPYIPRPGSAGLTRVRKRIALGFCDEMSIRQAKARKQEIMTPINQGKFLLQAQIRFGELVEKYRAARLPNLGKSTREKYETHLENHILPVFAKAELADIDRQSIEAWLNREATKHEHVFDGKDTDGRPVKKAREFDGLGWWARVDLKNILSAIFTAAAEWGLWQGPNPCAGVGVGQKQEQREKRIPSAAECQKFLAALPDTAVLPVEAAKLMVLTAIASGLRISEILGLQPDDVDRQAETVRVSRAWHRGEFGPTKSAASRRVREIGPLAELLAEYSRGKHYVFEREPGLPPDDRDLQQHVFRPAAEAVGIYFEGFGMHTFRRLNISWRQEAGATPFEAQKAAGHAQPSTTWAYTITDRERERGHVLTILSRVMPQGGSVQ